MALSEEQKEYKRAYDRERYHWLKEHGICVKCGCEKAVEGKVFCKICILNLRENNSVRYYKKMSDESQKIKQREREKSCLRKMRQYRKENRLCVICGKPLAKSETHKNCATCRAKARKWMYNKRIKNDLKTYDDRVSGDYCYRCLKPLENPDRTKGAQLCESCEAKAKAWGKKLSTFPNQGRENARKTNTKFFVN